EDDVRESGKVTHGAGGLANLEGWGKARISRQRLEPRSPLATRWRPDPERFWLLTISKKSRPITSPAWFFTSTRTTHGPRMFSGGSTTPVMELPSRFH